MKYKVGIRKNVDQYNGIYRDVNCEKCKDLFELIYKTNPIENATAKPQCLGIESLRDLPSQLKKPCSLSNLTSCTRFMANGMPKRVIQKTTLDKDWSSKKSSLIVIPKLIPSQNIKFQKLSLFNRDLIKFIIPFTEIFSLKFLKLGFANFLNPLVNLIITHFTVSLSSFLLKVRKLAALLLVIATFASSTDASIIEAVTEDEARNSLLSLIQKAEEDYKIPKGLLLAITNVESKAKPYALNVSGKTVIAKSNQEAVNIVRKVINNGITNIDLGVAQLNWYWHGKNFNSIEEMLTPKHNVAYAAKFLKGLYQQHGSWNKAVRYYHSANPLKHGKYSRKVIISWLGF